MLDKRIKFEPDETFIEDEYGTITFYFTGPKELLPWEDPDAEFATISIECPKEYISASYCSVEISPSKYNEETGTFYDYDWRDIEFPYEEIEELIKLAEENGGM